jgi:hypothetical protein
MRKRRPSLDVDHHDLLALVALAVEQFPPAPGPDGVESAVGGDLLLSTGAGEGLDVDLGTAGLARLIGDPPSVGREGRIPFVERCLEEGSGLGAVSK